MATKLLIVDCDGTVSRIKNPFYAVANELSCYQLIRRYADEYLAGLISYDELVLRQNPIFREAGRRYAHEHRQEKLSRPLFLHLLGKLVGDNCVPTATIDFLERVRSFGYQTAMISSGWDALVARAASEAKITYWRANAVLFTDGEFAGTSVRVRGDKTDEFEEAIRAFGTDYSSVFYLGDSEFDLIGMEYIHGKGGECLVHEVAGDEHGVHFPQHVRKFASLEHMGEYLWTRK